MNVSQYTNLTLQSLPAEKPVDDEGDDGSEEEEEVI